MTPQLIVKKLETLAELRAVQNLRYRVFVQELGGDGPMVDHIAQLERDQFDDFADHLLLCDLSLSPADQVVGTYRVMTSEMAEKAGRFYCADEYDLTLLQKSGMSLLELGRSCLHPAYRGGVGMLRLWAALAEYVATHEIDVMFGVASFHGTDVQALRQPLGLLHQRHLAPVHLRVTAKGSSAVPLDQIAPDTIDRIAAVRQIPALIKAYLRLGASVGDGAFVDHDFNTTDICLILERDAINALQKSIYSQRHARG